MGWSFSWPPTVWHCFLKGRHTRTLAPHTHTLATHTCTFAHSQHTLARSLTCNLVHLHTHNAHLHVCTLAHSHACNTHLYTRTLARHTRTLANLQACRLIHLHTRNAHYMVAHSYTHTRTLARSHTCTIAHLCTCTLATHTRTLAHLLAVDPQLSRCFPPARDSPALSPWVQRRVARRGGSGLCRGGRGRGGAIRVLEGWSPRGWTDKVVEGRAVGQTPFFFFLPQSYGSEGLQLVEHTEIVLSGQTVLQLTFDPGVFGHTPLTARCKLDHPFYVKDKGATVRFEALAS